MMLAYMPSDHYYLKHLCYFTYHSVPRTMFALAVMVNNYVVSQVCMDLLLKIKYSNRTVM